MLLKAPSDCGEISSLYTIDYAFARRYGERMNQDQWTTVDQYITDVLVKPDRALDAALDASTAAGLPAINVSPCHGKMLQLLAQIRGARRILEIGTLGGYSTIWMARALPAGGRLISLEADAHHAEVARANIASAGLADIVEIRVGLAMDTLPKLEKEGCGPFDLTFIDADKANNANYFVWALKLSRRGSVIVVDNVVRKGAVIEANSTDANVQGARHLNDVIAA